jgi:hypothetical protein
MAPALSPFFMSLFHSAEASIRLWKLCKTRSTKPVTLIAAAHWSMSGYKGQVRSQVKPSLSGRSRSPASWRSIV